MNKEYKAYLKSMGVIDEDSFMKIINLIPFEVDFNYVECYCDDNETEIARNIFDAVLRDMSKCAYCDTVDLNGMYIVIYDVRTSEELETIKNSFDNTNWSFNYDELKEYIDEIENQSDVTKSIIDKISLLSEDQLKVLEEWIDERF